MCRNTRRTNTGWTLGRMSVGLHAGPGGGLHFRPVAPSDHLKMYPWWDGKDGEAKRLADEIRRERQFAGKLCFLLSLILPRVLLQASRLGSISVCHYRETKASQRAV